MVKYTCTICLKEFDKKHNFIFHTELKKKPCQPIEPKKTQENPDRTQENPKEPEENSEDLGSIVESEKIRKNKNKCEYCNYEFSTNSHLNRHIKQGRCKVKKEQDNINNEQSKKIEEQSKEIKELYEMIKELKQKPTSITINNTDNSVKNNVNSVSNNVNNNIKLMAHGSEDLSKIDTKTILKYLCSDKFESIVPNVTKEIFRNKARPEFLNLEVTDLARNKAKYYDGDTWVTGNANDCAMTVFENVNSRILEPFEEDNIEKTVNMIIKDTELKPNYKTINHSRNYCGKLFSEDKEYIDQRNKICENIKNMMYSKKCTQIK